jgi:hypothetical protein
VDRLYSQYPGGGVGLGLLLLRLIVATAYIATAVTMFSAGSALLFLDLVLIGAAVLVASGAKTSVNAGVGGICGVILFAGSREHWFSALLLGCISISLTLLGPGGYSLDARLSGWRTIDLSQRDGSGH